MFTIAKPNQELKILISGDPKTGKTTNSMAAFPKPVIIDLERGSLMYQEKFGVPAFYPEKGDFEGLWHACREAVNKGYKTIIIDQFTTLYMWHVERWEKLYLENEKRSPGNKGEYYKLQPSDYGRIKKGWQDYVHFILGLPVHIVGIARRKDKYSKTEMMKVVGTMVDADKSLEYEFSHIFNFARSGDGSIVVLNEGERCVDPSKKLPNTFPLNDFKKHMLTLLGEPPTSNQEKHQDDIKDKVAPKMNQAKGK